MTASDHAVDDPTGPDFSSVALITIDTQGDTLDGQPLEIPGTSEAAGHIARLCALFRSVGAPIVPSSGST